MRITASRQEICLQQHVRQSDAVGHLDTGDARWGGAGRHRSAACVYAGWRAWRRGARRRSICPPKATRWSAARCAGGGRNRSAESNCAACGWLLRNSRAPGQPGPSTSRHAPAPCRFHPGRFATCPLRAGRMMNGAQAPAPVLHRGQRADHVRIQQRATWSGSRMVLSSTSLSTAAPTPKNVANRNASSTFSHVFGKHRLQAGPRRIGHADRAVLEARVDAGFLDLADQLLVELLVALGFALQRLIFERARVEAVELGLGLLHRRFQHRFAIHRLAILDFDALADAGAWSLRSAIPVPARAIAPS